MGIYFFYGDEDYLIDKELKKYRAKLDTTFSDMNYVAYDSLTYPELLSILTSQPMMFGKKMIVINTHKLIKKGNKRESLLSTSLEDFQIKEIEAALEGNTQNENMLDIFFVEIYNRDDKKTKPDTRRKLFKLLAKYNVKEFASIPDYKTAELISIINQMAKDKNIKIDNDASKTLIEYKGNNLRDYDTELDRLQLYAYPETTITKNMIEEICISNLNLFKLLDYISADNKGKAIKELRSFLMVVHPLQIIATLQTSLKRWIYMKLNIKTSTCQEIGQKLGLHEFVIKKTLEKMKNTSVKTLVDLKLKITEAEYRIKTGQSISPEEELENAVIG